MGLVAAEECPWRMPEGSGHRDLSKGGAESLPFLQQNGTTGLAETSLVSVPFQERCDKAKVGLTGWVQLNLRSHCCQETSLGSNLLME